MNYGFIAPKIDHTAFVLGQGNVPFKLLKPDGDWRDVKHVKEYQSRPEFDTYNCTGYNSLNQVEQYELVAFGELNNYSDRWLGIIAGTKPPGNDPHTVYEAIRKYGLIPDEMLPFTDDITNVDEYYSFKGGNEEACYAEGRKWLEKKRLYHEYAFSSDMTKDEKDNNMKVALKYSPLAIAVYAWVQDENGIYIRLGSDTHWTTLPAFKEYQYVYDSYDPVDKVVNQEIYWCKRIHIEKVEVKKKKTLWEKIKERLYKQRLIIRDFKKFWIKYQPYARDN